MRWILDNHYIELQNNGYTEAAFMIYDVTEGRLTPIMDELTQRYQQLKLFSLPMKQDGRLKVEMGLKGQSNFVEEGMAELRKYLQGQKIDFKDI